MTINHNFFSKKIHDLIRETPPWMFSLIGALPELLSAFLSMKNPPSLERLQLVSITIALHDTHHDGKKKFKNINISPSLAMDFLFLEGDLIVDDKKLLSLSICYFSRGQRQFFRLPPDENITDTSVMLPFLNHNEIEIFLREIKQFNNVFVDDKNLSGRSIFIPSHMMLWLIMHLVYSASGHCEYKNFHVRFFSSVPPSALCFSYKKMPKNFFARLADEKNIFMSVKASYTELNDGCLVL